MQYYLEDKDLYVDMPDSVPTFEAMNQIQNTIYKQDDNDVNPVAEVGKAFTRSVINSATIASLAIKDIGDSMQSEPLRAVAGNVGRGAHLTNINNVKDFSLFGFGSLGAEFYKEGFKEYQDDTLKDFTTKIGSKISKAGTDVTDKINAFADQVAPADPIIFNGDFMENPSWTRGVSAVTTAIPSLGMAVAVTAITKNPMAGAIILGGFDGLQSKEEALKSGVEMDKARTIGFTVGLGTSVMEGLSLGKFFNMMKKKSGSIGHVAVDALEGFTIEGITEASQQLFNNFVAKVGYDKSRNLMDGVVESLIAGAFSGGAVAGAISGFGSNMDSSIKEAKDMGVTDEEISNLYDVATSDMVNNPDVVEEAVNGKIRELDKNYETDVPIHQENTEADLDTMDSEELVSRAVESVLSGNEQQGSFWYSAKRETMFNVKQNGLDYVYRQLRPDRIFKMLDGFKDGVFTKKVWKPLAKADAQKKELYGNYITKVAELNSLELANKAHTNVIGKAGNIQITEDMAMFVYANSLNKDNRSKLINSGLSESEINSIVNLLPESSKKSVNNTVKYFANQLYQDISSVYKNINNEELKQIDNYFPILGLEDAGSIESIDIDITERFKPESMRKEISAVKERKGGKEGFRNWSYFDAIIKHINDVSHYVSHAQQLKDTSTIISNKKVKSAIRQQYGNELVRVIDKWVEDVSYGGVRAPQTTMNKVSRFIRTNFVTSVLGYNFNAIAKQPVSFVQGMNYIGEKAAMNGLSKFISNPKAAIKFVQSRSIMMKHRGFTQERELNEIVKGRKPIDILYNKGVVKSFSELDIRNLHRIIRDGGMRPIMWADQATTTSLWLGAYNSKISEGINESDAVDYADELIQKTQPMGGVTFLPDDYRGDFLAQLYTTFRNQPSQNLNMLFESTGEVAMNKNATMGDYFKLGKGYAYMMIIGGMMLGLITRRKFPNVIEFAQDGISMPLRGAVFIGDIVDGIINSINGKPFYAKRSLLPTGFNVIEDAYSALSVKDDNKKMKYFTKLMFELTGTPYAPVKIATSLSENNKKVKL